MHLLLFIRESFLIPELFLDLAGIKRAELELFQSSYARSHMARQKKKVALRIQVDGMRRFISVPAGRAIALHDYLRSNRVRSAPPEPAFTGFDYIELAKDSDFGGVQTLLNAWI